MPVIVLKTTGALLCVTLGIEMCHLHYPFAPSQLRVVYLIIKWITRLTVISRTLDVWVTDAVEGEGSSSPHYPYDIVLFHV